MVDVSNPPTRLGMNEFMRAADQLGSFAKQCRFAVRINPTGGSIQPLQLNDLTYMCEAVEYPGRGFDVTQIRYHGPSQVFPNNTMYNTANMSFLCRTNAPERRFFDDWMDIINPTDTWNFDYADNYYADIQIFQLAEYGTPAGGNVGYNWTLRKAWPTLVNPQQVTWADNDVLRLQVTFTYKNWDRN